MNTKQFVSSALCALTLSVAAPLALAQGGGAQQYQQGTGMQQQSNASVSDEQLQAYANAAQEVIAVQQQLRNDMGAADSKEEAQELQGEAQTEMLQAVENSGMNVEEYNKIANLVQADPAVRARVEKMID